MRLGLPLLQPERLREAQFLEALRAARADLFVVVAFRMLPEVVWRMPPLGTINLHGSLLPQYRGAAPINHAVMNGERTTGVTTFLLRHAIDTGDVLLREVLPIGADETAGELHDRMAVAGAHLLTRTVLGLGAGTLTPCPQDQLAEAVPLREAPKLTPAGCRIEWDRAASAVHDHVRGLSPAPGAWTELVRADGGVEHFKVLRTSVCMDPTSGPPGTVEVLDGGLRVSCGTGALDLLEVQPEGRKRMTAAAFRAGLRGEICLR